MSYKRGDVVLVPFPFTDLSTTKQRPALVVSSDVYNSSHDDLIIVAITGQIPATLSTNQYAIPQDELGHCGLLKPSLIKLSKILTLHQQLVIQRLGSLPPSEMANVLSKIRQLF